MNKKLEFFSSMAVAFIVLILVFLCIRFSGQGKFATHGGTNPSDVKCIYTSVWPDNEYTSCRSLFLRRWAVRNRRAPDVRRRSFSRRRSRP